MELRQLRYFAEIAEHGSLSRAAQVLYVAQSALSHQLAQLERELGTRLFHRVPRGVVLTEAGHVFRAHATAILRQAEEAKASLQGSLGRPCGKVNFGLPPSICNALAVPLLQAVQQRLPGVALELTEAASGDLSTQLKSGLVNLAILFTEGGVSEFLSQPLLDERFFLIAKRTSENEHFGTSVSFEDVLKLPLFLASAKQGVRQIVEQAARKQGLRPPNVVTDINSVNIMRSTLLVGLGYTVLPPMAFKQELDSGALHSWEIYGPALTRRLTVCASKDAPMTPATLAVFELATVVARELAGSARWPETQAISTSS